MERMSGGDALMYYLDGPNTPMQTLKVTVLDPSGLGRPMTLDDVEAGYSSRLARYPRLRQRLEEVPAALSRPIWVDDPDFDLRSHLSEETLEEPTRDAFDALLSRLATDDLDYSRPLWDATLVHNMPNGNVAVAMRIHHCVTDGSSAAAALEDLTSSEPDGPIAAPVAPPPQPLPATSEIVKESARDRLRRAAAWPGLIRRSIEGSQRAEEIKAGKPYLPPKGNTIGPWTSLNLPRLVRDRIAVTGQLPVDEFKAVSKAYGATVNDVLLTIVGTAARAELERRGERYDEPFMTSFGVKADPDARHLWGNHITTVWVPLHVEKEDPVARLRAVSRDARVLIAARRASGPERAAEWAEHVGPAFRWTFHKLIPHSPKVSTNIVTANVKGPAERRWAGPCEVVDFYSFAVLQPTSGLNCTVYSYAGNMNIGLLSSPDQHDEPRRFLHDMEDALAVLLKAAHARTA